MKTHDPNRTDPVNAVAMLMVATRTVVETLAPDEVHNAFQTVREKMKTVDPLNPDLWTVRVAGRELWGILDRRAGPEGEDLLTLLFPEEY